MIDIALYKQMHPRGNDFPANRDQLGPRKMSQDNPPVEATFILCLPTTIPGFSMQKKEWGNFQCLPFSDPFSNYRVMQ